MNIKVLIVLITISIILMNCAHTIPAPLKALKKSESKHTIYSQGYQYQRGLSNKLEMGFDLNMMSIGCNFRYHLSDSIRSLHSLQAGFGYGGIVARKIIKLNYKYTYQTNLDTYIRFGPIFSLSIEAKNFDDSRDNMRFRKTYRTFRFGFSFTYGGKHWWTNISYSHPIIKNYGDVDFHLFHSELEDILYGHAIYSPDIKIGYCF